MVHSTFHIVGRRFTVFVTCALAVSLAACSSAGSTAPSTSGSGSTTTSPSKSAAPVKSAASAGATSCNKAVRAAIVESYKQFTGETLEVPTATYSAPLGVTFSRSPSCIYRSTRLLEGKSLPYEEAFFVGADKAFLKDVNSAILAAGAIANLDTADSHLLVKDGFQYYLQYFKGPSSGMAPDAVADAVNGDYVVIGSNLEAVPRN